MSKPPVERRAHTRYPKRFHLEAAAHPSETTARMMASDLSLGGLYCTSPADFPEMTRLAVRLLLPGGTPGNGDARPVEVEAVVVRRKEVTPGSAGPRYELALYFTRLDDEARAAIARFLARGATASESA